MFAGSDVLVIERMLDLFAVFGAENVDAFNLGELGEASGTGQSLEDGHTRLERKCAGLEAFPGDVDAGAVELGDADGYLRIGDVFLQPFGDDTRELRRGEAGGLHVIQKRQRDASVRTNRSDPRNLVFLPHV